MPMRLLFRVTTSFAFISRLWRCLCIPLAFKCSISWIKSDTNSPKCLEICQVSSSSIQVLAFAQVEYLCISMSQVGDVFLMQHVAYCSCCGHPYCNLDIYTDFIGVQLYKPHFLWLLVKLQLRYWHFCEVSQTRPKLVAGNAYSVFPATSFGLVGFVADPRLKMYASLFYSCMILVMLHTIMKVLMRSIQQCSSQDCTCNIDWGIPQIPMWQVGGWVLSIIHLLQALTSI